jgi:hypothetical protein
MTPRRAGRTVLCISTNGRATDRKEDTMSTSTLHPAPRRRLALGVAVAAIAAVLLPVAPASAKPADAITLGPGEIPYLVSSAERPTIELGPGEIPYVDDGTAAPVSEHRVSDGGYELGVGIVSSAAMLLLLTVGGALVAIRHSRRTKLSPA